MAYRAIPLIRPSRRELPNGNRARVVFLTSIGGIGDALPIPLLAQWYKQYYPQDVTILYDSVFLGHYFKRVPGVDEIVVAAEHYHGGYVPRLFAAMDPALSRYAGVPLAETRCDFVASTHHAHERVVGPPEIIIKLDFNTVLGEILRCGFETFGWQLKDEHEAEVQRLCRSVGGDGRMLVGMQTRGACPFGSISVGRLQYVRELTRIAEALVQRYGARILVCGDDRLATEDRYRSGDFIALDELTPNIYYKLEVMKRTKLFLGASSGFSLMVNLLRSPEQIPAMQLYTNPRTLLAAPFDMYPDYDKEGGGRDVLVQATFRDCALNAFVFDVPHTPEKVLKFVARYLG